MTVQAADEAVPILLVDDDPTSLAVLRQTLNGRGYKIFITRNGEEALKVARREHPLVILLDVMMPGMDGYETCRRLKADSDTAFAAVIFLSALEDTRDKVRGLEVGAVDFITKPFQAEEVVARVNGHITIQKLRCQLETRNRELARELAVAQELLSDARRRVEGPLLGNSAAVRALREMMGRYAATPEPLMLTGPYGAGHEAVARGIHHASTRSRQAFLHVNCTLLQAGQDPGLLTGTTGESPRASLWELADGGTLYLEEVQRLPVEMQERLAGFLAGETQVRCAADCLLHGAVVCAGRIPSQAAGPAGGSATPRSPSGRALRRYPRTCALLCPAACSSGGFRGSGNRRSVHEPVTKLSVAGRSSGIAESHGACRDLGQGGRW